MQDEPVMSAEPELLRHEFQQPGLDRAYVLSPCQAGAVCDTEYVRVHCDGRLAERRIQDHVCGLASYARQAFQLLTGLRDRAMVPLQQKLACGKEVFRLGAVKPDALDVPLEASAPQLEHRLRGVGDPK